MINLIDCLLFLFVPGLHAEHPWEGDRPAEDHGEGAGEEASARRLHRRHRRPHRQPQDQRPAQGPQRPAARRGHLW